MQKLHRSVRHLRRKKFQTYIFLWWADHKRDLPWRRTHDPYKILISEMMLQQTQVVRVLPKYNIFLAKFPDIRSLARASTADVLRAWKGMGYNRRALYLKKSAEEIVKKHRGNIPRSEKELVKLPGLGIYTARAILVFAFRKNVPLVDTNIRQIITHFFFDDAPQKDTVIWETAKRLLPIGKSWEWHQALMDYGAIHRKDLRSTHRTAQKSPPYKESIRFYRGRIVDLLREKPYTETQIITYLQNRYTKSRSDIEVILEGLIRDGLVRRDMRNLQLPK